MTQKMITREIKKVGNGTMIALHKDDLRDLGADVGSVVTVTITTADDNYMKTRRAAKRMRQRYSKTLEILGQ